MNSAQDKTPARSLIGCNLHRGVVPGGFSRAFGVGRAGEALPKRRAVSSLDVRAAANEVLAKRGCDNSCQNPFV